MDIICQEKTNNQLDVKSLSGNLTILNRHAFN